MIEFDSIMDYVQAEYPDICVKLGQIDDLIFEERVKMACFYCGNYNTNWKCRGNLPKDINYQEMIYEYSNVAFFYIEKPFGKENFDDVRKSSSLILHKGLLRAEKYLWDNDAPFGLSFIGGSCKLCKDGCGETKCKNPYEARSPVESIGINVIQSVKKSGIKVSFPPNDGLMRIGLLLW